MVKKSVTDYIRSLLQKGYDISAIRSVMLKYGYSNKDIDEAVDAIYHPTIRHEIHLSHTTIFVIIFILFTLTGVTLFFYYFPPKGPSKLLDLNLEPVNTNVKAGDSITFLKELSNLGSSKRYDVIVKQEILDPRTFKVITEKTETRAIETFGSTSTSIPIPAATAAGDYILRVIVEYDNKKAVATLPVKISSKAAKESCFDGIKNQNEADVDCGGICKSCKQHATECDDNDQCTEDIIEDGKCVNREIVPCCGNNICEENEDCSLDCGEKPQQQELPSTETLEEIKGLAKTDPGKAMQQCNKIDIPDLKDACIANIGEIQLNKEYCPQIKSDKIKDLCYSKIAQSINDNSLCAQISADSRRDSCYAYFFIPPKKDYSVCDKLTNSNLRQSCESLRQLYELNQQIPENAET